ncbi:MAG TPA: type II toxin-antitoxin system HicB family antitoxin [Chloroflexota bacterium]|nr:type II toxin-antitoxin system HicB family antitoxin [Chloroflexota bacterium]
MSDRDRRYTVVVFKDGEGYSVLVPALPGCFSQGATPEDALENAREAVQVHLAGLEADGEPVPDEAPSERPKMAVIAA